jgi:hypothetical protein
MWMFGFSLVHRAIRGGGFFSRGRVQALDNGLETMYAENYALESQRFSKSAARGASRRVKSEVKSAMLCRSA